MSRLITIRKLALAGLVAVAAMMTSQAQAHGPGYYSGGLRLGGWGGWGGYYYGGPRYSLGYFGPRYGSPYYGRYWGSPILIPHRGHYHILPGRIGRFPW